MAPGGPPAFGLTTRPSRYKPRRRPPFALTHTSCGFPAGGAAAAFFSLFPRGRRAAQGSGPLIGRGKTGGPETKATSGGGGWPGGPGGGGGTHTQADQDPDRRGLNRGPRARARARARRRREAESREQKRVIEYIGNRGRAPCWHIQALAG
jgi:hypothetical protein